MISGSPLVQTLMFLQTPLGKRINNSMAKIENISVLTEHCQIVDTEN